MNPLIAIPTYWSLRRKRGEKLEQVRYDHSSTIGTPGELRRCLKSLEGKKGVGRIALLVGAEMGAEQQASMWVRTIAADFPNMNVLTIGNEEAALIGTRLEELGLSECVEGVILDGYGAIRNVAFAVAAIMGHDSVIFIDDDEVVEGDDFVERACYGLGGQTKHGVPVLVKTGVFVDKEGSWKAPKQRWYDVAWKQNDLFNQYIEKAMGGARLSRANTLCGGLTAVHYEAFRRVAFDPWIARGEDLDYLLNLRMYGLESWLDDEWTIKHLPPRSADEADRFSKDIYRWLYEQRKLEFARTNIDLLQVRPKDLEPYPGPFLEASVDRRIKTTAILRGIAKRKGHLKNAFSVRKAARQWADENHKNYFDFEYHWPEIIAQIECDDALAQQIIASECAARIRLSQKFYDEARYEKATYVLTPIENMQEHMTEIAPGLAQETMPYVTADFDPAEFDDAEIDDAEVASVYEDAYAGGTGEYPAYGQDEYEGDYADGYGYGADAGYGRGGAGDGYAGGVGYGGGYGSGGYSQGGYGYGDYGADAGYGYAGGYGAGDAGAYRSYPGMPPELDLGEYDESAYAAAYATDDYRDSQGVGYRASGRSGGYVEYMPPEAEPEQGAVHDLGFDGEYDDGGELEGDMGVDDAGAGVDAEAEGELAAPGDADDAFAVVYGDESATPERPTLKLVPRDDEERLSGVEYYDGPAGSGSVDGEPASGSSASGDSANPDDRGRS